MDNKLIDLLDRLDERSGAAYTTTKNFFQNLGFSYVNIGIASTSDGSALGMFTNMREAWLSHYVDAGYHTCDVMLEYAMSSTTNRLCDPRSNLDLPSRDKARSDRMLAEVQEEGLVSSLILPRHSAVSDHMIGYNLCSDLSSPEMRRLYSASRDSILLGAALTQNALLADVEATACDANWFPATCDHARLSPRETEVIKWLTEGYRNDRIADKLKISNATVNFHITSAKRKLGAKTREQAVAIAVTRKLF